MNTIPFEIRIRGCEDDIEKFVQDFKASTNQENSLFSPLNKFSGLFDEQDHDYCFMSLDVLILSKTIFSWLKDQSSEWLHTIKQNYPTLTIEIFWHYTQDDICIGYLQDNGSKYIVNDISELRDLFKSLASK
jgi:hypothetical protein